MRLQKPPRGFLGAFDLKTEGTSPDKFGDTTTPFVDMYDQYLADKQRIITTPMTLLGGTTNQWVASERVPRGQMWRVLLVSIDVVITAADVALTNFALFAIGDGTGTAFVYNSPVGQLTNMPQSPVGGQAFRGGTGTFNRPGGTPLPSGWTLIFGLIASAAPAGAYTVNGRALVQVLED